MTNQLKLNTIYPKQRAFISGASADLKFTICRILAKNKWTIGVVDKNIEHLNLLEQTIDKEGGKAFAYHANFSRLEDAEKITSTFLSSVGGIDLFINCTGVSQSSPFKDFSIEQWDQILTENQFSVIYGCHFLMPSMIKNKSGAIVNITVTASHANLYELIPFSMAGKAVRLLSNNIKERFSIENIAVTNVTANIYQVSYDKIVLNYTPQYLDSIAESILIAVGQKKEDVIIPHSNLLNKVIALFRNW